MTYAFDKDDTNQQRDRLLTTDSPAGQGIQVTLALPVEEEELIVREEEASDRLT